MPQQETTNFSRKKLQRVYGGHFVGANRVTLLWRDREYLQTIFDAILSARRFVCLAFYIFKDDETGRELAQVLKNKAADGVEVLLIYDHFGSFITPRSFWRDLEQAGVRIAASRPFKWTAPLHYVQRDHRKLIIIDGETAFTGGLNIANEYWGHYRTSGKKGWRDTGVRIRGPVVADLYETFRQSWWVWTKQTLPAAPVPMSEEGGVPVLPIFASSARGRRRMRKLIYHSINTARASILLTTAYFTPSWRMIHVLEAAVRRGVQVKLLLPGESDVSAAHFAARYFYRRLLQAGVEIYAYSGQILHAKSYVFDGCWSIIGSANLDFLSLRRNDEGNVGILSEEFGREMEDVFLSDITHSVPLSLKKWEQRPWSERLQEWFFALFRRRL